MMGSPKTEPPSSSAVRLANLAIEPLNQHHASIAPMASNAPIPTIVTRREWVIPPRPKPGRKPATDPPPTKRKAQNRAAQRAFRERRAARVGELEEELEETREGHEQREAEMKRRIATLEVEILRFSEELQSWKTRCETLDRISEYERREKEAALVELSYIRNGALATSTDAVPIPPKRPRMKEPEAPSTSQITEGRLNAEQEELFGCENCSLTECACVERAIAMSTATCGRCNVDGHCECLEETIKVTSNIPVTVGSKRSHSPPSHDYPTKRLHAAEPATPLETDFTAQFSSKPKQQAHSAQDIPAAKTQSAESCGFCEDGTFCVCAEVAAEATAQGARHTTHHPADAPLVNEITPPPSDTDINGGGNRTKQSTPNKMHPSVMPATSDASGPGTCEQCQRDPKSATFCKSLARLHDSAAGHTTSTTRDCCGGNATGGPCCKTAIPAQPTRAPPILSCADTYKVLSTHERFKHADENLDSCLSQLQTASFQAPGRAPLEVEAASVMGVLKLFDRRFDKAPAA